MLLQQHLRSHYQDRRVQNNEQRDLVLTHHNNNEDRDRLNELSSGKYKISEIFKRRDTLHQLIDPTGLGGFGVLIQGKNLAESELSLRGLNIPSMF